MKHIDRAGLAWRAPRHLVVSLFLLCAASAPIAGCHGHTWVVLKTSGPGSSIAGARRIAVSFNYSRLRVGGLSEEEFIQRRLAMEGPTFADRWKTLKATYERAFIDALDSAWPHGTVVAFPSNDGVGLVVVPTFLNLGRFSYARNDRTTMVARMGWIVRGQAVEEIQFTEWSSSSIFNASVVQHAGRIGTSMGERAGEYLTSRQ